MYHLHLRLGCCGVALCLVFAQEEDKKCNKKIKNWNLGIQVSLDTFGRIRLSVGLHLEDGAQLVASWVGKSSLVGINQI